MVLVGPASKIAIALDGESDISHHGHHIRFSIVKGFKGGKVDSVPLQEVSQLVEELPSPWGVHGAPGASQSESFAGSLHCKVNICFVSLSYICNHLNFKFVTKHYYFENNQNLSSGRVEGLKGLARDRVNKLVVDEQPCVCWLWFDDRLWNSRHGPSMLWLSRWAMVIPCFELEQLLQPGVESPPPCPTSSQLPTSFSEKHQKGIKTTLKSWSTWSSCPSLSSEAEADQHGEYVVRNPVLSDRQLLARLSEAYPLNRFRHPRRTH